MQKLDTMIDCLILALNGYFKMNIMFCVVSIHPVKGYMNELTLTRLLLDSLTSQHLCTESYINVII